MELIKLRVYNVGDKGSININPELIETVIVSPYNDKYILILALSQGARYQLATSTGKYIFDTKEEAEIELNTILAEASSSTGGDAIDLDEIGYLTYAAKMFYDSKKSDKFKNAWEDMKEVDGAEIERDSTFETQYGTLQYPNGEDNGVIIPDSVTSIGNYAFYYWTSNDQPLVIPNSVTSIGEDAFSYWSSNNQPLTIPNSVTSIGSNAFSSWHSNNQPLVIPNSVTSIGNSVFHNWTSNNQPLTIPNSVTSIGEGTFSSWQSNNQPLVIPNSVKSIGYGTFQGWHSNNQPLVIPNSVTSISGEAFNGWFVVPYIIIEAETPPTLSNQNAFDNQNNAPIYVPDESVDAYKTATNWSALSDRIFSINDFDNTSEIDSGEFGETFTSEIDSGEFGETFTSEIDSGEFI